MSGLTINPSPTMTQFLVKKTRIFRDDPIVIADVGARDGFSAEWKVFDECMHVYCFEPDEAECARLNAGAPNNIRYIPTALGHEPGRATLYHAKLNYSTGLYKADRSYFSRLLNRDNGAIVGEQPIQLSTLDDALGKYGVREIDFVKLDAEGAELDILRGAPRLISSPRLAGVLSEVRFQREINHSPIFSDLDAFIRPLGFHIFDLQIFHQSRHVLPYQGLQDYRLPTGERFFAYTKHGQIMDGNALYFRDLLAPINSERQAALSASAILKYAALFEIYSLNDCAAELLVENQSKLNDFVDCSHLLDLLTPGADRRKLTFREYRHEYFGARDDIEISYLTRKRSRAHRTEGSKEPLVSIVMFCRNGMASIRRSIESVLGQSYPNIEFVIQDGASTDGTLEILKSYGDALDVISVPDEGTNDGFWRALQRCTGKYIGTCLADEELLPDAVARAVAHFQKDTNVAAITGDAYFSDISGNITGEYKASEFDLLGYLLGDYCPNFSASFFRRESLVRVGLFDTRWKDGKLDSVEFEIWCRLGTQMQVKYVPEFFSKYGIHPGQLSHRLDRILGELASRTMIIDRFLFGTENFFAVDHDLRDSIVRRQYEIVSNHLTWNDKPAEASAVRNQYAKVALGESDSILALPPASKPVRKSDQLTEKSLAILRALIPKHARARIPLTVKLATRRGLQLSYASAGRGIRLLRSMRIDIRQPSGLGLGEKRKPTPDNTVTEPNNADWDRRRGMFYHATAMRFRDRGQTEQAWLAWTHARMLNDVYIDSMALQANLTSPSVTDAQLLEQQQQWAGRYVKPLMTKVPLSIKEKTSGEKVVVAYHSSFWHINTGKAQALPFIAAHDRSRFKIIGYSPMTQSADVQQHFDEMHFTGKLSDADFVDLVRNHNVDIFVDLNGLSYPHRVIAMASRCAPVQISYLNHTGTLGVDNVDYVIADNIAAPVQCDPYYSEAIYRLPRCFFCFSYQDDELPPIVPPPVLINGHVTFGCFGGGFKLNWETLQIWAALLRRNARARLIVQNLSLSVPANRRFLLDQFQWLGIDPVRVTVLPGADRQTVLRNYALVDVSLDTYPYCGGNTIAESVWQGVPVVSYKGNRFTSAYGSSLLQACGLSDLIAHDFDDYVRVADEIGQNHERLIFLRNNLRRLARDYGLSDVNGMARSLESAYRDMLAQKTKDAL